MPAERQPPHGSGLIALDADTGALKGFFQPAPTDSYRLNDLDVDVSSPPTLFSRPGQDVVTFGGKNGAVFLLDPATMGVLVVATSAIPFRSISSLQSESAT